MLKWINPCYWGERAAQATIRWENRRRAEQLFNQADLLIQEAAHYHPGPLKDACISHAQELANKAFALCDK